MAECPECGADVSVPAGSRVGELVVCDQCRSELEMLGLEPPELALAPEVEEDWGE